MTVLTRANPFLISVVDTVGLKSHMLCSFHSVDYLTGIVYLDLVLVRFVCFISSRPANMPLERAHECLLKWPGPDKRGGLSGSTQYLLRVYLQNSTKISSPASLGSTRIFSRLVLNELSRGDWFSRGSIVGSTE
jgi:hypothetical protein